MSSPDSSKKQSVGILGFGRIGRAIGHVLDKSLVDVLYWDKKKSSLPDPEKTLEETVSPSKFIFLCIPSWAVRSAMTDISPYLRKDAIVISLSKGIEEETVKTMDEVLQEFLPPERIVILGGPMLAEEIEEGAGCVGAGGVINRKSHRNLADIFPKSDLIIEFIEDMRGVALAGVLKNIYSIGLGVAEGIGWRKNKKGWFVTGALEEMAKIIDALGGKRETAYSVAGLGDFIATGYSPHSSNRRVGKKLSKGVKCNIGSEGAWSMPSFVSLLEGKNISTPIFDSMKKILCDDEVPKHVFENLYINNHPDC